MRKEDHAAPWRARPHTLAPFAVAAALAAALAVGAATAQAPADAAAGSPEPAGRSGRLVDAATVDPDLVFGDAREFTAAVDGEFLRCAVTMARPIAAGMFTCVHVLLDCDADPTTGLDGLELEVRAAVGSRFHPNSFRPADGGKAALDLRRGSRTVLVPDDAGGKMWVHQGSPMPEPQVDGATIRFDVPLPWIKERGGRYSSAFTMKVHVVTACSDQPLQLERVCNDDGITLRIDGSASDWSGVGVSDTDGELHPAARPVDITRFRLEHDRERLYACVEFAGPGVCRPTVDDDVEVRHEVSFHVAPTFPRYQRPLMVHLGGPEWGGRGEDGMEWRAVAGRSAVELSLQRAVGQTRYRVFVWSDYRAVDRFAGSLRLDWGGR